MRALLHTETSQLTIVENVEGYDLAEWTDLGDLGDIDPTLAIYDAGKIIEDLDALRLAMTRKVDSEAEAFRLNFITPGSGQAMTYQYKANEVKAWTADNSVATPFLSAEAASRGMTVAELAAEAAAQIAAWTIMGSKIEGERMGAKAAIAAGVDAAAIRTAATVDWEALAR